MVTKENNIENNQSKSSVNKYLNHPPLTLKKKLYISEFLAERIIQVIAFISIAAIIAIFYYVFHESIYAFSSSDASSNPRKNEQISKSGDLKPESYNPDETQTELKPETYNPDETTSSELKPETYNPNNAQESKTDKIQEKTVNTSVSMIKPTINTSEKGLNIKSFVTSNSEIDGKKTYVWQPISDEPKYSFVPLFIGALKVTLIGIIIAAPIGILAAIFTVSFAPKWMKEIIKPAIEILAGFPSIVIGFFCLITLATIIQNAFGTVYRLNSFVGGIGMAFAVIPVIYTVTEDALSAVPRFMKEASLAIGASRWQTAWRVMLPAATPGVFAAIILGFGRAFGETMIALMATGNAALVSTNIFDSVRTMAATIGAEMAEVEFHSVHYGVLFLIGAVLFVVTFSLNALAEFYVRKKLLKKFQGL